MELSKDGKGSCYILSHERCGYHESIFVTLDELRELQSLLFREFEDIND